MTTTADTATKVTGWALGTLAADPFANVPQDEDLYGDLVPAPAVEVVEPATVETSGYTAAQVEKATDAIEDGAVMRVGHLFLVVSSDGTTRYETAPTGECSCMAAMYSRRCWHTLAARLADAAGLPATDPDEIGFAPLAGAEDGAAESTDPLD